MTVARKRIRFNVTAAPASALASQVAAMINTGLPNQWAQVTPTPTGLPGFNRGGPWYSNGQGSGFAVAFCDKFARDPINKKFYFIGSDHGGDTIFAQFIDLDNAWTQVATSVPWGIESGGTTSHGYNHTVWDSLRSKLWHQPYGGGGRNIRRWDGGTTWLTVDYSSTLFYSSAAKGVEYFPDIDRICIFQLESGVNGALMSIDPANPTGAKTIHGSGATFAGTGDPHNWMRYSPQAAAIYFGGGNGNRQVWKMNAAGVITKMPDVPAGITGVQGPGGQTAACVFVNPSNGNIVVMQGLQNWYELNILTSLWGSNKYTGTTATQATIMANNTLGGTNDAYGIAASPTELGVVVFLKNWTIGTPPEMWIWKP